jgi:hypothetical protein
VIANPFKLTWVLRMRLPCIVVCIILCWSQGGCGGSANLPPTAPAEGIVLLDGEPLTDVELVFHPEKGPSATGRTDPKGAFTMSLNGKPGAVPGKSKVTFSVVTKATMSTNPAALAELAQLSQRVPEKYRQITTTDITVDLGPDGDRNLSFSLHQLK